MKNNNLLTEQLNQIFAAPQFQQAQTLLIVPPFISLSNPSLGIHILQAYAKSAGHHVAILYANALFAEMVGHDPYNAITFNRSDIALGERVFAHMAYGVPLLNRHSESFIRDYSQKMKVDIDRYYQLTFNTLVEVEQQAQCFTQQLSEYIAASHFSCVGCTTMFNQTSASVALLNTLKQLKPEITTIIGGANCLSDMAKGIASLTQQIDFIFSGESETVFVEFLTQLSQGQKPPQRIILGQRCDDLDSIPAPEFADYFSQLKICQTPIDWDNLHSSYECSRGCWWGQKHHCTFCGEHDFTYRIKSPDTVIEQLKQILAAQPSNYVNLSDDIMPIQYFKTLLPRLKQALPDIQIFMNQKANLSLKQVRLLNSAGIYRILPGMESLSSPLLKAMDKGTTGRQNIQLLRYARSSGLHLTWFFLYCIPEEKVAYYQKMLEFIPLLTHLQAPHHLLKVSLMRFSMYTKMPSNYGINNLRPSEYYRHYLPETANIEQIAYYYHGDYPTLQTLAPNIYDQFNQLIEHWQQLQLSDYPPVLHIEKMNENQYILTDTREVNDKPKYQFINEAQAAAALVGHPLASTPEDWPAQWAIDNQLAIKQDRWIVPLATANADLLELMEAKYKKTRVDPQIAAITL